MLDTNKITKRKRTKKKSEFIIVPKKDMQFFGKMLMLKQISYSKLLDKIKEEYPNIKTNRFETLRYFMITNHYVLNEKSLENININVEKSKLIQKKRDRIIESLMERLLTDDVFLKTFFDNEIVQQKIKEICKEI